MDILKGSLDGISRPPLVSRSRPGSRISSSQSLERPKLNSAVGSLEVLTPHPGISELSSGKLWALKSSDSSSKESFSPGSPETENKKQTEMKRSTESNDEMNGESITERSGDDDNLQMSWLSDEETDILLCNNVDDGNCDSDKTEISQTMNEKQNEDFVELHNITEDLIDSKLDKAIKKMQALDELLLRKLAKEKEVKAQGLEIRKQLWEELQHVTKQTSGQSHEESVNTNKFLALTPPLNEREDTTSSMLSKLSSPLFPTQLPLEENEDDIHEPMSGIHCDNETSDIFNENERSSHKTKETKSKKNGVDFVQKNIMLAKDAGSHVLLMDDEKLRLEQLLGDIYDGSDEDSTVDVSGWLVPGEGYTPETGEYDQLAKIDTELQIVQQTRTNESFETDYFSTVSPREALQEVSMSSTGNLETAPGEKVLRYTKELREQTIRLKEIDQQLEDIERKYLSAASLISARYSSLSAESPVYVA
ncbi:fibrous sheath-interacting protein 1 [Bombina bombina]|uniref:fibrous sheath-interacting protein 1 n=1 Tax=Bombina bombina TaxID=8345 RepID=UPI00235B2CA0|nr:fibrous sheath-interacting protein 1 [Bombina bombina]